MNNLYPNPVLTFANAMEKELDEQGNLLCEVN